MSMPTILPSGQLHPDALKGPFVKYINSSTPATKGEPGVKVSGDAMAERWKAEEKRVNEYWREHRDGKCQGLNAEKSKILFCALFTKAILPPQYRPAGQAPAIPVRHTSHPGCRAGIRLPTAAPAMCPPLLSR